MENSHITSVDDCSCDPQFKFIQHLLGNVPGKEGTNARSTTYGPIPVSVLY